MSWRYWLVDTQIDTRGDQPTTYFEVVFEPLSAERLGDAGRYEINFRDEFQTLELHKVDLRRDGRWLSRFRPDSVQVTRRQAEFEANLSDSQASALLVIDDVRVGDLVRIAYSVRGSNPVLAGQMHYGFSFASDFPVLARNARVLFPDDGRIDARPFRDPPAAQQSNVTQGQEWRVNAIELAPLATESDLPDWYIDRPTWLVSSARSWEQVVDWALPLYPLDDALPAELAAELEDQLARSEAERAAWALQRVQEEVRYFATILGDSSFKPNPPTLTWERRFGDCKDKTQLLSSLLRALRIDAKPALVSLSGGRNLDQMPPSATGFDHVIVAATIDGERLWLDPTLAWQRGHINQRRAGIVGFALVIDAGQTQLTALPEADASQSEIRVSEHYQVSEAHSEAVSLTVETLRSGRAADQFRRTLASGSPQALQRGYVNYYRKHFGKVTVVEPLRIEDEPEPNHVQIVESYLLEDPWSEEGLQKLIAPTAAEVTAHWLTPEQTERSGPFIAAAPLRIDYKARLSVPESWRPDATSFDEKLQSPAFVWESQRRIEDKDVVLHHRYVGKKAVLDAEHVEAHLQAVRRAGELSRLELRVATPVQQRIGDRDARLRAILKKARERTGAQDES
jgi:transglutaminase-like putative cysteine protease